MANWTEYNTGVLKTKVGQFGVTEAEFTCFFIHILTGIFGQQMWQTSLMNIFGIPQSFISSLPSALANVFSLNLGPVVIYWYSTLLIVLIIFQVGRTIVTSADKLRSMG